MADGAASLNAPKCQGLSCAMARAAPLAPTRQQIHLQRKAKNRFEVLNGFVELLIINSFYMRIMSFL
jgi:hypothetical protein